MSQPHWRRKVYGSSPSTGNLATPSKTVDLGAASRYSSTMSSDSNLKTAGVGSPSPRFGILKKPSRVSTSDADANSSSSSSASSNTSRAGVSYVDTDAVLVNKRAASERQDASINIVFTTPPAPAVGKPRPPLPNNVLLLVLAASRTIDMKTTADGSNIVDNYSSYSNTKIPTSLDSKKLSQSLANSGNKPSYSPMITIPVVNGDQRDAGEDSKLMQASNGNMCLLREAPDNPTSTDSGKAGGGQRTKLVILKTEVSIDDDPFEGTTVQSLSGSFRDRRPSLEDYDPSADVSFASVITASDQFDPVSTASLSKGVSFESINSATFDSRSLMTATSGGSSRASSLSDSRVSTPTENNDFSNKFISSIEAQLRDMEKKCAVLESENEQLKDVSKSAAGVAAIGESRILPKAVAPGKTSAAEQPLRLSERIDFKQTIEQLQAQLNLAESLCQKYQDENEELQTEIEQIKSSESQLDDIKSKLAAAESLSDELLEENEGLRKEVRDLQEEIEELQDQYREGEVDEYRELQRELEQTAKNCRVLQFKLRKAERGRDQTEADRQHLDDKIRELIGVVGTESTLSIPQSLREKEQESELKLAKEVSVRLHNELELNEEKRCKLEDELFQMKQRLREMEIRAKRRQDTGAIRREEIPPVDALERNLEDSMERETDLKEHLRFAEKDLEVMRKKVYDLEIENEGLMQQLSKFAGPSSRAQRGQMKRSFSEGAAQIQLELAEHEAMMLKEKIDRYESQIKELTQEVTLLRARNGTGGSPTSPMEISRSRGALDLPGTSIPDAYYKQKIKLLEDEVERLKRSKREENPKTEADQSYSEAMCSSKANGGDKDDSDDSTAPGKLARSLRFRSVSLDSEDGSFTNLDARRQLAIVEQEASVLRNRIADLENDYDKLYEENKQLCIRARAKTHIPESSANKVGQMETDIHKFIQKITQLEQEKETMKAEFAERAVESEVFKPMPKSLDVQAFLKDIQSHFEEMKKSLETIETQVKPQSTKVSLAARRYKPALPDAASNVNSEDIARECRRLKKNLDAVKTTLEKKTSEAEAEAKLSRKKESSMSSTESLTSTDDAEKKSLELAMQKQKTLISGLKKELTEIQKQKQSAVEESNTATTRLLQTEERWNKELEKLKESYEHQVTDLQHLLKDSNADREEKTALLLERNATLQEKSKKMEEIENRAKKAEHELGTRYKDIENMLDQERKKAGEFQTKYLKLEQLYDADRKKISIEKDKFKSDLQEMKKKNDDILTDFEKLKQSFDRKQSLWMKEKKDLETTIQKLHDEIKETETKASKRATELASAENRKLLNEISDLKRKHEGEIEKLKLDKQILKSENDKKVKEFDSITENQEQQRKEINLLKSRIDEQKSQLEDARRLRDEAKEELTRWQQTWSRERSELAHKLRQEEKVQQAEHQALQLKYESRIKVMEDSSKRIQSQLAQCRHERDQNRDSLQKVEKKLAEERDRFEVEEDELRKKITESEKTAEYVEELKEQFQHTQTEYANLKKTAEQDKAIWEVQIKKLEQKVESDAAKTSSDKPTKGSDIINDEKDKLLQQSMRTTKDLRGQLDEVREHFEQEISKLKKYGENNRKEWSKERQDLQRKIRDLQEQVKISEIDRRNMLSTRDESEQDRHSLVSDRDRLLQSMHDMEIHQLANKYKLDKVSDQILAVQSKLSSQEGGVAQNRQCMEIVAKTLDQLYCIRDDMAKTKELEKSFETIEQDSAETNTKKNEVSSNKTNDLLEIEKQSYLSTGPLRSSSAVSYGSGFLQSSSETNSRLRSPSPAPRKITSYPNPPPNFIIGDRKAVVDEQGNRTWAKQSILRRSISMDPTSADALALVNAASADNPGASTNFSSVPNRQMLHTRSASSDANNGRHPSGSLCDATTNTDSEEAIKQKHATKVQQMVDLFGSLKRSELREKRKMFGGVKSSSIETTDTGQMIGAMGVQVLPPGVSASTLPDDVPFQKRHFLAKSSSSQSQDSFESSASRSTGSKLLDRIKRRTPSLTRQSQSLDKVDKDLPPQPSPTPSTHSGYRLGRKESIESMSNIGCFSRSSSKIANFRAKSDLNVVTRTTTSTS